MKYPCVALVEYEKEKKHWEWQMHCTVVPLYPRIITIVLLSAPFLLGCLQPWVLSVNSTTGKKNVRKASSYGLVCVEFSEHSLQLVSAPRDFSDGR